MSNLAARFGLTRYEADEYYRIALDYYLKRNLDQALVNIGHALRLQPHNAEYHAAQGYFFLEDGVMDKAQVAFDAALRHNPYEVLANYGKGVIAYKAKDWQTALPFFMTAWAADAARGDTLYYLALTQHHKGDNRAALQWMQQAHKAFEGQENAKKQSRDAARWLAELEKIIAREDAAKKT
jgi:tetratricopeptide (TPR) repeat protein